MFDMDDEDAGYVAVSKGDETKRKKTIANLLDSDEEEDF